MKVDLGDGVLGPAAGAETITAWLKIRLEDRLEHRLEGGLDHPVPARWRCPAGGACHRAWGSSHGDGTEPPGLEIISQLGEEGLLAPDDRDVVGGLAVHPAERAPRLLRTRCQASARTAGS